MWVAAYINCVRGKFEPHGPFDTADEANEFILAQTDPGLWSALEVKEVQHDGSRQR